MASPSRTIISNEAAADGSLRAPDEDEKSAPDEPYQRRYRKAAVRTATLSEALVEEEGGALTRKGTPRLDLLCAARAAHVQRKSDRAGTSALRFDSGEEAPRRKGEHVKSIQGHAEDLWRRIYKRPVPEEAPLDDPGFRRFYDRTRRALKRSDLLEEIGPAVRCPDKKRQDRHGKRWALSERLREAEIGRRSAGPRPLIRCSEEAQTKNDNVRLEKEEGTDLWTEVERAVAREEDLHREFTHAVTAAEIDGPRRTASARRWERRYVREGGDRARYRTIGQWRPEAVGRGDRREQAVRVPWIVAEIDGKDGRGEKSRAESDRLARRLLRRLDSFGVDLSEVVVSYSGNASIHVRIPDGAVGAPIYRNAQAATESLARFFDRLCGQDEALRRAIDNACLRPGQMIRAIGSIHEGTGRQTVGATADRYLSKPAEFLWSLAETQFQYSPPERFPVPRQAGFCAGLSALLEPASQAGSEGDVENERSTVCIGQECGGGRGGGAALDRARGGVGKGEPWGLDVGRPEAVGRNWAALFVAHDIVGRGHDRDQCLRALRQWNRRNSPSLPRGELKGVLKRVWQYQRGTAR